MNGQALDGIFNTPHSRRTLPGRVRAWLNEIPLAPAEMLDDEQLRRRLKRRIAVEICLLGLVLGLAAATFHTVHGDPVLYVTFLITVIVSELTPARTTVSGVKLSAGFLVVITAAILIGGPEAATIGAIGTLAGWLQARYYFRWLVTNLLVYTTLPFAAGVAFHASEGPLGIAIGSNGYYALALLIFYVALSADFFLVALETSREGGPSVREQAQKLFFPLWPLHVVTSLISLGAIALYLNVGTGAVLPFAALILSFQSVSGNMFIAQQRSEELEKRVAERTAELEQANEQLSAFGRAVAHDLRAPLRSIASLAELSAKEEIQREELLEGLSLIAASTRRADEMLSSLSTMTRVSFAEPSFVPCSPAELVEGVLEDLAPLREGRELEIVVNPLPDCVADPGLLRIAFQNLISNAIKYTAESDSRARITIAGARRRHEVAYAISDNGPGIPEERIPEIFELGVRCSVNSGLGVGLHTTRRVVEHHGGRVWAANLDPGAVFGFALPLR